MKNPFFSIIVPIYNAQESLKSSLESCLSQTFSDFEVVLINDGSSDNSINIAKEYTQKDTRFTLYTQDNQGTLKARMLGVSKARGEYITFLDSDDVFKKNTLQTCYESIQQYTKTHTAPLDILSFGVRFDTFSFKKIVPPKIKGEFIYPNGLKAIFLDFSTPPWHIWAKCFRTPLMLEVNSLLDKVLPPKKLVAAEDALHCFCAVSLAQSVLGIRDNLYIYCNSSTSITRNHRARMLKIANFREVIKCFQSLSSLKEIAQNPFFTLAKDRVIAILQSTIALELRTLKRPKVYLKACLKSQSLHKKWQTRVRMIVFLGSLGRVKI